MLEGKAETDPCDEVIFGRRRPDSVAIEWPSKTVCVLEFKHTSDQRHNYRDQGELRARTQHDVLVKSLDTVAKGAKGENAGWTNQTDHLCGGHMWICACANIQ